MLTQRSKFFMTLLMMIGFAFPSKAQTWTAGVPMNQLVISNFATKSQFQLTGCFPGSTVNFHFYLPAVSGIQYYFKVTSIDANSAYMGPGNDTLAIGDSIAVNAGTDTRSIYYFGATATSDFKADLYAAGTPTTVGQFYPCNITNQMWISNLMICNEGLSAQVPGSCMVQSNPTTIFDHAIYGIEYIAPSASNNYQLGLNGMAGSSQFKLYSLTGELLLSNEFHSTCSQVDCSSLTSGMYLMLLTEGHETRKEKVLISK